MPAALRRALIVLAVLACVDLVRPAEGQWSARVMIGVIQLYQRTLSPYTGVTCRFEPSCSHYAVAVIRSDGAVVGFGRTVWRIMRCGPWTAAGTNDQP